MGKFKGIDGSFKGRHFDREIIVLCVRWYLRYKLSFRDLTEMMAERGLSLAHAPKEVPVGHYDHALGEAFHARVRQTLESAGHGSRAVVARR
jgi:transposase-like protein